MADTWRGCACVKILYSSRGDAHRALSHTGCRQVYRCPDGHGWHLSSMSRAEQRERAAVADG